MLDKYIFANIAYDIGVTYNFASISNVFTDLVVTRSADVVSKYDSYRDSVQVAIDQLVAAYSD